MDKLTHHRSLATLAERQYGIVTRAQLIARGVGRGAIDSWLRAGRLHSVHRGIYALGHGALNQRGIWLAAVLAYGEGALLSHRSAATLWQLIDAPTRPVDVTSAHGRPGRPGIRLHRSDPHPLDSRAAPHTRHLGRPDASRHRRALAGAGASTRL